MPGRNLLQKINQWLGRFWRFDPASRTIWVAVKPWPYSSLFAPSSERNVEPSRDTPPNRPFARDQERISAFIATSVSADVLFHSWGFTSEGWRIFLIGRQTFPARCNVIKSSQQAPRPDTGEQSRTSPWRPHLLIGEPFIGHESTEIEETLE
jgi:hypothetical protein